MADQPVIFVGGLGRSGAVLLERLLGELPEVAALGGTAHLWTRGVRADEPCGCGRPFSACPFWSRVGTRAFGQWRLDQAGWVPRLRARVDRVRRVPALALGLVSREAELSEYVLAYSRVYAAAAEVAGARVVVDSSRRVSLAYCLAAIMDLRVVHVVRDPRALAAAHRAREVRSPGPARWTPARTAVHWLAQNLAFAVLRRKGVQVVRVRYEDLLADPGRTLTRLARRLDLGDPGTGAGLGAVHTVPGTPPRPAAHRRPVALPFHQRWLVTALTLPLLRSYGYRLRYRPPAPPAEPEPVLAPLAVAAH
ncbi:sulfotransferase [Microbispora sp. ATCC PTA-5024]|uniref:sulfotransferase n=1 Tax=Microbispora sp. ATCC PTA-5024 TaxID=316330 RepID=UPI0003DBCB28|nr:sulfotransferase [Microbispora sp. ATCC PTA-5024]ETK31030.1 sulfotransferase [Microbispora sp. ATCC PTA-5024]